MNVNDIMNSSTSELNIQLKLAEQIDKITTNKMNEHDVNLQLKLSEYEQNTTKLELEMKELKGYLRVKESEYEEKINELQLEMNELDIHLQLKASEYQENTNEMRLEMNELKRYVLNNLHPTEAYLKNYQKAKYVRVKFTNEQSAIHFIQFRNKSNTPIKIEQIDKLHGNMRYLFATSKTKGYEFYNKLTQYNNTDFHDHYSSHINNLSKILDYFNDEEVPCNTKNYISDKYQKKGGGVCSITSEHGDTTYTFVLEQEEFIECILAEKNGSGIQIEMLDTNGILFYKSSSYNGISTTNSFQYIKPKERKNFPELEYANEHRPWHVFKVDPSNLFDPEHSYY